MFGTLSGLLAVRTEGIYTIMITLAIASAFYYFTLQNYRNGALVTPPVTSPFLESVTRSTLLELAAEDLGLRVEEREVDRTELYVAKRPSSAAAATR